MKVVILCQDVCEYNTKAFAATPNQGHDPEIKTYICLGDACNAVSALLFMKTGGVAYFFPIGLVTSPIRSNKRISMSLT